MEKASKRCQDSVGNVNWCFRALYTTNKSDARAISLLILLVLDVNKNFITDDKLYVLNHAIAFTQRRTTGLDLHKIDHAITSN